MVIHSMSEAWNYTLGIEEEFQVVDLDTMVLKPVPKKTLREGLKQFHEHLHREMNLSTVELASEILDDIQHASRSVRDGRLGLANFLKDHGLGIASAGTHPFSDWRKQGVVNDTRHSQLLQKFRHAIRSSIIFGLHVHVAIPDREVGLAIANSCYQFIPLLLALSANSPFYVKEDTGFASFRAELFLQIPRTGLPHHFDTVEDYDAFLATLVRAHSIDNAKNTYWDVRIHPTFPTIEFRICDAQSHWRDTIGLAAIIQALVASLHRDYDAGKELMPHRRRALGEENRWRASLDGIHGQMIDFETMEPAETVDLLERLFTYIEPMVEKLGSEEEVEYIRNNVRQKKTGSDKQVAVYDDFIDFKEVAKYVHAQTNDDLAR